MSAKRIAFVAGALANRPWNGGGAEVRATWVKALARLGFEVWFVERIARATLDARPDGVRFFRRVARRHGFERRSVLLDERGAILTGAGRAALEAAADRAELLVDLGGHLAGADLFERFRFRAYVDLDPGYTQIWGESGEGARLAGHDAYFTVGLNVGSPAWNLPTNGIDWRPLAPPVVLADWLPFAGGLDRFTTVAAWRGAFGRAAHDGRTFGLKAHEFRRFLTLPELAPTRFEIALAIDEGDAADRAALASHGWRLVDPRQVAGDPDAYREYLRRSGAEFSVAQGIYVEARSGWISDRTARYLAAGRPALVQDTGAGDHLPTGEGLLLFREPGEAIEGAAAIARDYERHRAAALDLARAHFDSDRVVGALLEAAGLPRAAARSVA